MTFEEFILVSPDVSSYLFDRFANVDEVMSRYIGGYSSDEEFRKGFPFSSTNIEGLSKNPSFVFYTCVSGVRYYFFAPKKRGE